MLTQLNYILQARYQQKRTVEDVLTGLSERGIKCKAASYHECLSKVLKRLSDDQATELGVDLPLLRAVRGRLGLPTGPSNARNSSRQSAGRFHARGQQRPVWVHRRARLPSAPPTASPPPVGPTPTPAVRLPVAPPLSAAASVPTPNKIAVAGQEPTYQEWHTINAGAVEKISAATHDVLTNWHGTVVHLPTKREFTVEELMREFDLTDLEARSLFLTL